MLSTPNEGLHKRHPIFPIKMSSATTATPSPKSSPIQDPQRLEALKTFDESKIGVKGLVDQGLTTIPSFFVHHGSAQPGPNRNPSSGAKIPVVDFSSPRSELVDQVRRASSDLGFFQIVNHSVPVRTIHNILDSLKAFNELPETEKARYYRRELSHGIAYSTNFDLYNSKAASWRDTLQVRMGPTPPEWEHVPTTCVDAIGEWDAAVRKIGEEVLEILCEGLGVKGSRLKELSCLDARFMAAHYYPHCPQPELTAGLTSHTDPGVVTFVVQNEVPGLQVKVGEEWVDVEPIDGAIVINIGDILQIMSNDIYRSVEHRVYSNPCKEPRVSAAVFVNPGQRENMFGPLPELVSAERPARYREFQFADYMKRFFSKELDGKTLTNFYGLV